MHYDGILAVQSIYLRAAIDAVNLLLIKVVPEPETTLGNKIMLTVSMAALLLFATAANAQNSATGHEGTLEEILVTATKRASTIQDVPFSINAMSEKDIQRTAANSLEELSRNIAGLTTQNLGPGQSQMAIRGVSAGQIVATSPASRSRLVFILMSQSSRCPC